MTVRAADMSDERTLRRSRIAALRKRADHLAARIAASEKRLTYDEIELDALHWALSVVEDMP